MLIDSHAHLNFAEFEGNLEFPGVSKIVVVGTNLEDSEKALELARKHKNLFATVGIHHVRDTQEDIIEMLKQVQHDKLKGVFHCFSGDENYLKKILELLPEFYVSFAGNVTFKNAQQLRDLAKLVPVERLLVETDSPFLAPEPHRGTNNSPTNVKIVADKIAEIKGVAFEKIAEETTKNATKLFNL